MIAFRAQIEKDEEAKKSLEWVREMYAFSIAAAMMKAKLDVKVGGCECVGGVERWACYVCNCMHFCCPPPPHLLLRLGHATWRSAELCCVALRRCCRSRPSAC